MAATISATGTFTALPGVFDAARSNLIGNEPRLEGEKGQAPGGLGLNLDVLKTMEGVEFSELKQFVQLVQVAYGLNFWSAALLVQYLVRALFMTKSDTVLGDEGGSRLFVA